MTLSLSSAQSSLLAAGSLVVWRGIPECTHCHRFKDGIMRPCRSTPDGECAGEIPLPRVGDVVECREDALLALLQPQKTEWWGSVTEFTPVLLSKVYGDGKQLLQLFPINERPRYWIVRIDSKCTDDDLFEILDDIYEAIDDEFGPIPEHDDGIGDERPYFPMFDWHGTSWNCVRQQTREATITALRVCQVSDVTEQEAEAMGYRKFNETDDVGERWPLPATAMFRDTCRLPLDARGAVLTLELPK